MRYTLICATSLAVLFALQALALHMVGGRTIKSESNFFSSVGRIQAGVKGSPEIMLLGSSITGRLPDRAQGFDGLANMGCDGGSAADTLRAIHEGRLPQASVLLVEANALHIALNGESEVASAIQGIWFQAGLRFSCLSAYARPSAFLYSLLLAHRTGNYGPAGGDDLGAGVPPGPPPAEWEPVNLTGKQREICTELTARIRDLRQAGCRIIMVWLPPARQNGIPPMPWIRQLVMDSGCEWWDLGQMASEQRVRLTDGVHMDAPTAGRTANSIITAIFPIKPDEH